MPSDTSINSETKVFTATIRNRIMVAIIAGVFTGATIVFAFVVVGRWLG